MPHFEVRPAASVQFTGPESVEAVAELVRQYLPHASYDYSPAFDTLRLYSDGRELNLKTLDWVAVIGGSISVIPPGLFEGSIEPQSQ